MAEATHHMPHLPPTPWRFIGYRELIHVVPGAAPRAGGTCDHCSTGIRDSFWFRGSDGVAFKVGSTCVVKIAAIAGTNSRAISQAEREIREVRNAKSRARAAAKRATQRTEGTRLLWATRKASRALPHPRTWGADQGLTLANWAAWMLRHGGSRASLVVIERLSALQA